MAVLQKTKVILATLMYSCLHLPDVDCAIGGVIATSRSSRAIHRVKEEIPINGKQQ